jgi:hypothetical protein
MRAAVARGDSARVTAFYRGFLQADHYAPSGQQGQRNSQGRPVAAGGRRIYSREQIKQLYEQRRHGQINDANWARREADILRPGAKAGSSARLVQTARRCRDGHDQENQRRTQSFRPWWPRSGDRDNGEVH